MSKAQQLQSDRQSLVEKLQKDGETLSPEEVNSLQRDVQEKTTDLEFILGKIQAKQTETVEVVTRQLDPALRKILAELIEGQTNRNTFRIRKSCFICQRVIGYH